MFGEQKQREAELQRNTHQSINCCETVLIDAITTLQYCKVTHPTTAPLPLLSLTSRTFFPASLNVDLQSTCPFSREGMHPG